MYFMGSVRKPKMDVWAPGGAMEAFIQIKQCKKGRKKTVDLNGILRAYHKVRLIGSPRYRGETYNNRCTGPEELPYKVCMLSGIRHRLYAIGILTESA
jgi:hypothetical protein